MSELSYYFKDVNLIDFTGTNESNIDLIRSYYPKLKIVFRGDEMKVIGSQEDLNSFNAKFEQLNKAFRRRNLLTDGMIKDIMDSEFTQEGIKLNNDAIAFGPSGIIIKAQTTGQKLMVKSINESDMLFAIGPAGTGKTYTAVALAVRALKNKEVRRIILTRPAVEAGENLGFLPGDLKEKLDPYLMPLYDALRDMIHSEKLNYYLENGYIEIAPLAFMRGRTLDHAFVILDEAQNATSGQLKMFLTRMGRSAKFAITGDLTQIDLPKKQPSGLVEAEKRLKNVEGISFVQLDEKDVIRHRLVKKIIKAYDTDE